MDHHTIRSERVFEGKVFNVRIDHVSQASGDEMRIDVIEHSGAVVILPMDAESRIWLVRQYRHPTGGELLELPAGVLEQGEDPQKCAIRECREEIGMAPGAVEALGSFFLAPGYSTEYLHVFLAKELTSAPLEPDADEAFEIVRLSLDEVNQKIRTEAIVDAKTLASLYLLMLRQKT